VATLAQRLALFRSSVSARRSRAPWWAGRDLNFDLQVYSYYLGYSAFVDRFALDYLAASFQGYQSPVPYMLLYWLDSVGTPPFINASIHAAIHALNLILLFLLAQSLVGTNASGRDRVTVVAFWLLGAVAPIYWHLVGTSYADLLTSVPVLAGLWLTARAMPGSAPLSTSALWGIAVGAALAGVATGLRVHNVIFVSSLSFALALARFPSAPGQAARTRDVLHCRPRRRAAVLRAVGAARLPRVRQSALPVLQRRVPLSRFPASNLPLTNLFRTISTTWPRCRSAWPRTVTGSTRKRACRMCDPDCWSLAWRLARCCGCSDADLSARMAVQQKSRASSSFSLR
jgi:hypothetical protein